MDRLSGLDASFLYLETPAQLMHVCGVIVLDPSTMPGRLLTSTTFQRGDRRDRIRDVPDFTRKLAPSPAGPRPPGVGPATPQFDIERHVHRLAVPQPGRVRRAHPAVQPPGRPPARPLAAAVGDVGDRGLRRRRRRQRAGRGLLEDAPRHRRRRLRRQPDLATCAAIEPDAPPLALAEITPFGHEPDALRAARPRHRHRVHRGRSTIAEGAGPVGQGRRPDRRPGPRRHRDGRPAHRAAHVVQRHDHRPPRGRPRST